MVTARGPGRSRAARHDRLPPGPRGLPGHPESYHQLSFCYLQNKIDDDFALIFFFELVLITTTTPVKINLKIVITETAVLQCCGARVVTETKKTVISTLFGEGWRESVRRKL